MHHSSILYNFKQIDDHYNANSTNFPILKSHLTVCSVAILLSSHSCKWSARFLLLRHHTPCTNIFNRFNIFFHFECTSYVVWNSCEFQVSISRMIFQCYISYTKGNKISKRKCRTKVHGYWSLKAIKGKYLPCHFHVGYPFLNYIIPSGYLKGQVEMCSVHFLMHRSTSMRQMYDFLSIVAQKMAPANQCP